MTRRKSRKLEPPEPFYISTEPTPDQLGNEIEDKSNNSIDFQTPIGNEVENKSQHHESLKNDIMEAESSSEDEAEAPKFETKDNSGINSRETKSSKGSGNSSSTNTNNRNIQYSQSFK